MTAEPQRARGRTRAISVAPMMDRTDRHFRRMLRLLSAETLLYTEMVTCAAILNGDREHLLGFDPREHPIALQLGGDDPAALAECARIAAGLGYDEINLNVGCPSDRVQSGNFGACLMREPDRVAASVEAMRAAVGLPVTVKHRIGVDELDRYEDMLGFVDVVAAAGCDRFSVHARKAWLSGLSPKQNRSVPPLRHAEVHRLKRERPALVVEINGGITNLDEAGAQLDHVDAVMIGRAAWDNPYLFAEVDRRMFGAHAPDPGRAQVVAAYLEHVEAWLARPRGPTRGPSATILMRPLHNLFVGVAHAKRWKQAVNRKCQAPRDLDELVVLADQLEPSSQPPPLSPDSSPIG
jgi:tRNA-dihydrouridine synthase A